MNNSEHYKVSAQDVADYFLSKTDLEQELTLCPMKLQKYLYYAQGYHLGMFKEPLFSENIEAWKYGPVVNSVYTKYKRNNADALPKSTVPRAIIKLPDYSRKLLDTIFEDLKIHSAWALSQKTHREAPWLDYYEQDGFHKVIPNKALKDYFTNLVEEPSDSLKKALTEEPVPAPLDTSNLEAFEASLGLN